MIDTFLLFSHVNRDSFYLRYEASSEYTLAYYKFKKKKIPRQRLREQKDQCYFKQIK